MQQYLFSHFATAGEHPIVADADARGLANCIYLVRIVINGGSTGTITLSEAANPTSAIAVITPEASGGVPFPRTLEYGIHVEDTLMVLLGANTDITVVYQRLP